MEHHETDMRGSSEKQLIPCRFQECCGPLWTSSEMKMADTPSARFHWSAIPGANPGRSGAWLVAQSRPIEPRIVSATFFAVMRSGSLVGSRMRGPFPPDGCPSAGRYGASDLRACRKDASFPSRVDGSCCHTPRRAKTTRILPGFLRRPCPRIALGQPGLALEYKRKRRHSKKYVRAAKALRPTIRRGNLVQIRGSLRGNQQANFQDDG